MNIKKIYLTRHGQTDFNLKGIVQGSGVDSSLNEMGRAQASDFYTRYKDVYFDKVYVSALKRTQESIQAFIDQGTSYEAIPELNEISWGVREGIPVDEEGDAYYQSMLESWRQGETQIAIEGGESPDQVFERMKKGLKHILAKTDESQILICMHGRAMRVMLCLILNYPLKAMDLFEHENLCLYQLIYNGSTFVVEKFNDTNHVSS